MIWMMARRVHEATSNCDTSCFVQHNERLPHFSSSPPCPHRYIKLRCSQVRCSQVHMFISHLSHDTHDTSFPPGVRTRPAAHGHPRTLTRRTTYRKKMTLSSKHHPDHSTHPAHTFRTAGNPENHRAQQTHYETASSNTPASSIPKSPCESDWRSNQRSICLDLDPGLYTLPHALDASKMQSAPRWVRARCKPYLAASRARASSGN